MTNHTTLKKMAREAKKHSFQLAAAASCQKNHALKALANNLNNNRHKISTANHMDLALGKSKGLNDALLERLSLENKLDGIIQDIENIILLPDPIGETFDEHNLPNQLHLAKHRTPIGVLGVIYESRPNVTIDISALTINNVNMVLIP